MEWNKFLLILKSHLNVQQGREIPNIKTKGSFYYSDSILKLKWSTSLSWPTGQMYFTNWTTVKFSRCNFLKKLKFETGIPVIQSLLIDEISVPLFMFLNPFENCISKISFKFPTGQWVKYICGDAHSVAWYQIVVAQLPKHLTYQNLALSIYSQARQIIRLLNSILDQS